MTSIQLLAALTAGTGIVILALAIPLIMRRVPPNGLYGVRTKAAFASANDWYRINHIGGRYLAVAGALVVVAGAVGFFLPESKRDTYSIGGTIFTLLAVFIPCLRLCLLKPEATDQAGKSHRT